MKQIFKSSFVAMIALLAFVACSDDEEGTKLPSLNIEISMPEGFTVPFNGTVTINCEQLHKEYSAMAKDGVVDFKNIYPGIYSLKAQLKMTKDEAKAAAPSLDIKTGIILNGGLKAVDVKLSEEGAQTPVKAQFQMNWTMESALLISKIYANGTKLNETGKVQNMPKYWEIYNNSSEVVYLDGLCLAQAHGNTTSTNPCELYVKYQKEATYAARIAKLPGIHGTDKNIALQPGKSFVIAWHASNFILGENSQEGAADKCTMNVDLSTADYEIESTQRNWVQLGDNPQVPNMLPVYDCLPTAGFLQFTQALFIFFASEEEIEGWTTDVDQSSYTVSFQKTWKAKRVPNEVIIDAVETLKASAKQQKRIPDMLDAAGVEAAWNTGSIFDRRVNYIAEDGRKVLQDTNNSKQDFVVVESRDAANFDGSHLVIRDYDKPEIQPLN